MTTRRIGLLGGSFNPAHGGHRRIALGAAAALGLDEVWLLVSPGNPLKEDKSDMAPLAARLASARRIARHAPIRARALETRYGTRFTIDTLREIVRRHPRHRFVWLMGSDNLASFDRWRKWREIAMTMPIAVIARPGYYRQAHRGKAWAWLGRFVQPPAAARNWTTWRPPALVLLRFRPDPASATALRRAHPGWHLSITPDGPCVDPTRRPLR